MAIALRDSNPAPSTGADCTRRNTKYTYGQMNSVGTTGNKSAEQHKFDCTMGNRIPHLTVSDVETYTETIECTRTVDDIDCGRIEHFRWRIVASWHQNTHCDMTPTPAFSATKHTISTRKSIPWAQSPPTGDSSAKKLTSRTYTDLDPNDTPSTECAVHLHPKPSLPLDESPTLNWSFAGVRRTLETGEGDGRRYRRWGNARDRGKDRLTQQGS